MVTRKFLQKLADKKFFNRWCKELIACDAGSTNIDVITDNVYCFEVYNLLPSTDDDILSGHYDFYVNLSNFEWCVYKSSNYGSLSYTLPLNDDVVILTKDNVPDITKQIIESTIASKMVDAYNGHFPDKKYLFGDKEPFRYGSHISDYRKQIWTDLKSNTRTPMDLKALSIIEQDFINDKIKSYEYVGRNTKHDTIPYGKKVTLVYIQYLIHTEKGKVFSFLYKSCLHFSGFNIGEVINGETKNIKYDCKYSDTKNIGFKTIFLKLPEIIESF